ncbi:unnamed protein product [Amoebophrya sp. A120]|nr:unnamed protein product [Amoebophrya sp. A120]|eukprot:GSA120T00000954001.1
MLVHDPLSCCLEVKIVGRQHHSTLGWNASTQCRTFVKDVVNITTIVIFSRQKRQREHTNKFQLPLNGSFILLLTFLGRFRRTTLSRL